MSSKKVRLFPRSELPSNGGGWKVNILNYAYQMYLKMWTFDVHFFFKSCLFLKTELDNLRQILQATQCNAYSSTDTQ
jgi:hypothetical protein